jgi:membrane protein involved in colicin uptake
MSMELAQMALWDGDPALAQALEAAARLAGVPKLVEPVRDPAPRRKQAS